MQQPKGCLQPTLPATIDTTGPPQAPLQISVTSGVVSRIEVTSYAHGATELLGVQIDAAINSGNSGGPVFNEAGECVGVAFQSYAGSEAENIGCAGPWCRDLWVLGSKVPWEPMLPAWGRGTSVPKGHLRGGSGQTPSVDGTPGRLCFLPSMVLVLQPCFPWHAHQCVPNPLSPAQLRDPHPSDPPLPGGLPTKWHLHRLPSPGHPVAAHGVCDAQACDLGGGEGCCLEHAGFRVTRHAIPRRGECHPGQRLHTSDASTLHHAGSPTAWPLDRRGCWCGRCCPSARLPACCSRGTC